MTDRELLEFAAKAAGYEIATINAGINEYYQIRKCDGEIVYGHHQPSWNPLTDDAAALRLAVKLNLTIDFDVLSDGAIVSVYASWNGDFRDCFWNEWLGKEPYAATRRAIVRAAAEIGSGMRPFPSVEEIEQWVGQDDV